MKSGIICFLLERNDAPPRKGIFTASERIYALANLSWSPDGCKIACEGDGIILYEAETERLVKIQPSLKFMRNPRWDHDGTILMIFVHQTERRSRNCNSLQIENQFYEIIQTITPEN
jgi:hypothetical protein